MVSVTLGKLVRSLTVLLGVSFLTFIIGHASGDPVRLIARGDATLEQRAQLRHSLGLDRPVLEQYRIYVSRALHGDLGMSYRQHVDVTRLIALRLPNSLELAAAAFLFAMTTGFALGILCVIYRDSVLDHAVAGLSVLGQVVPGFWLGLVLVLLFAVHWRILPVSGSGDLTHLILPALTLALPMLGRTARMVRGGMLEVLQSDYIRTARAKGLSEREVLLGHAARNALLPLVTQAGLELGDMVGSAFIIETVFAWPGLGRMTVSAVQQRDFLVVQGCVLVIAAGFVLINLAVDLLYAVIDPRVRIR
ncbi:MAG TPA: ABC transporter permease [Steroidobacteraceae bacterium]|jgi:ABC-type dipeptide/oligopeptide/nickel transport system permease component|nr:ABC transporter permease [Steroidobacteraceae bacterium]